MDHKELLKRRFEFYTEIKNKVKIFLGRPSRTLESYENAYTDELKKIKPQLSNKEIFFKALKTCDILLFGDFHSEPQSIRSLLRVCRKLKPNQIALGLECVQFCHQEWLDKYFSGDISESDFIQKTEWLKNWDFPFEYVKPLFHWASTHKVPVFGINQLSSNLKYRDKALAQNIHTVHKVCAERLLIVQIGDYHLAKKHLVFELKKELPRSKVQVVFQSPDELYFELIQNKKSVPDFVKLGRNRWAVMAILPWVKWQNYLLWLESTSVHKAETDGIDMTDHIARSVQFLSETLKISTSCSEMSIYSLNDIKFSVEFKGVDVKIKNKIKKDILDQKSFFVPELKKGYLAQFSLNHVCKLAAEYFLYKNDVYTKTISDSQKYFLQLIWIEMLTYFFTKIINPKLKANTVFDMRSFLKSENFADHGKDVLAIALSQKLKEMNSFVADVKTDQRPKYSTKSYAAAARLLGGIMGEKVFWAYSHKRLVFPAAKSFLFQNINHKLFQIRYYDLIEVIDNWPGITKSKFDQF